jgi:hypothetical protein
MNRSHADPEEQTVAKFAQICASQNDLFALDEEGNVYQYDFNAKTWEKLVASRSHEGLERGNHGSRGGAQIGSP